MEAMPPGMAEMPRRKAVDSPVGRISLRVRPPPPRTPEQPVSVISGMDVAAVSSRTQRSLPPKWWAATLRLDGHSRRRRT